MNTFTAFRAWPDERLLAVVRPESTQLKLPDFIARFRSELDKLLLERGAILFRDFGIDDVDKFDFLVASFGEIKGEYRYGSTPRTQISNGIFTASEYPPSEEIALHSENSYQREWPLKLIFCCVTPATSGGETPIGDLRRITTLIDKAVLEEFTQRGVRYVRNYSPYLDVSWQNSFRTKDRFAVDRLCSNMGIQTRWRDDGTLQTIQECQGATFHPDLGETVFFNQAHLFHPSALSPDLREALIEVCGGIDYLPRNAFYGDGGAIEEETLHHVRQAFRCAERSFQWRTGDVLLLDNMQVAHGRKPYSGQRVHLAALLSPFSAPW